MDAWKFVYIVFHLLCCFDHGYPVLGLGCTCMLPGYDLGQLGVREEIVA